MTDIQVVDITYSRQKKQIELWIPRKKIVDST